MKNIDVCGIASAIVDLFAEVSQEEFDKLGLEKGTMRLVEPTEQRQLLDRVGGPVQKGSGITSRMTNGGSVCNSIFALAQLGGKGALVSRLGDDPYGVFFRDECEQLGIRLPGDLVPGGATGVCVSIVTPDAERTMRTSLGVNAGMSDGDVHTPLVADARWLFVEGYLFAATDSVRAGVDRALEVARTHATKVAITCSEPWVVNAFGEHLNRALEHAVLVFANEDEAKALSGRTDLREAGRVLQQRFPHVAITAGPRGALLWWEGQEISVPAFECTPCDLTGAGDMFAGSFLYGITHGLSPYDSAHRANFLAREVICQVGARLDRDVRSLWEGVSPSV
jgi:sugar/nucleoside kinase (ribokinase family)